VSQRAISQPFVLEKEASTGSPRKVPLMVAVCGPPWISVQAVSGGVGANGLSASMSELQVAGGSGTSPPDGSHVRAVRDRQGGRRRIVAAVAGVAAARR
jgi:hypothetical protein